MVYNGEINEVKGEIENVNILKVSEAIKLPISKPLKVIIKSQKVVTDACENVSIFV